jgi:protein-tyrosine phosphatase
MAAAILQQRLAEHGVDARVTSAGTRPWSQGATDDAVAVMREHGLEISAHENRQLTRQLVEEADLVLGMTRDHVSIANARSPDARRRTFLVGELARLGSDVGPRHDAEPVSTWVERVADARPLRTPLGRAMDEIADPAGQPIDAYRRTAAELDARLTEIAALLAGVSTLA